MSQPCNKFSVAELSVEEQAVLAFCGKVGCTCINSNLRGYKVGDFKHGHLAPLLQVLQGYPQSAKEMSKWGTSSQTTQGSECCGGASTIDRQIWSATERSSTSTWASSRFRRENLLVVPHCLREAQSLPAKDHERLGF